MTVMRRVGATCMTLGVTVAGCEGILTVDGSRAGFLVVANETKGGAFDLDGFTLRINEGTPRTMELNETHTMPPLPEGSYRVALDGLARNCAVAGDATRDVHVEQRGVARVDFAVTCTPSADLAGIRLIYARHTDQSSELLAMNADGSETVVLESGGSLYAPDVSPDRTRIVFIRDWDEEVAPRLGIVNSDGTGGVTLPVIAYSARWSPDGGEITVECLGGSGLRAICLVPADGGAAMQITGQEERYVDFWPDWAPDGTRVVFTRDEDWLFDSFPTLWVVARDGSGASPLAAERGGVRPVWSPVGRIAFRGREGGIHVMNADGSGRETLLGTQAGADATTLPHDWSADGRMLLFTKNTGLERTDIYLLEVDDGTVVRLTADGARNLTPTFW